MASRWRHCVQYDRPGNGTSASRSDTDALNNCKNATKTFLMIFCFFKIIFTTREEDRWFPSYAKQIADNSQITLDKIYFLMAAVGLNPFKIMHYMMRYIKPMCKLR